jgi:hypothetical protein
MYSGGYGFGNAAGPNFNNANPQQQGPPQQQQQQQQQLMYNQQQQQFAGMAPQGGFGPGANPQVMAGGMMQNTGMQHVGANGQSEFPPSALACVSMTSCTSPCHGLRDSRRVALQECWRYQLIIPATALVC